MRLEITYDLKDKKTQMSLTCFFVIATTTTIFPKSVIAIVITTFLKKVIATLLSNFFKNIITFLLPIIYLLLSIFKIAENQPNGSQQIRQQNIKLHG